MASKTRPAAKAKKKIGVLHSVYFPQRSVLKLIRKAARIRKITMSALMRDACIAEAQRIIKRSGGSGAAA